MKQHSVPSNAKSLDYVVFYGKNADDVIANYRNLSGNVPMLPLWAYGFWQCRERYTSGKHLVQTVEEFRRRNLADGCDCAGLAILG